MLEFVCYFIPAFISISLHKYLLKEEKNSNLIIYYGVYVALTNLITLLIVFLKNHYRNIVFSEISITYCFKYLLVSTIISVILPYFIKVIIKNIEINVEVKRNESNKKNK